MVRIKAILSHPLCTSPLHLSSLVQKRPDIHTRSPAMIHSAWLSTLALLTLTLPVVKGQRNTCSPNDDGFRGAKCIRGQGTAYASAFCSSFLPITTPVEISTNTVTAYDDGI